MKPSAMDYEVKHVLMTADAVGGVWTYCIELAYGLAQLGVQTTLVVMGPAPNEQQREQAEAIPGLDLVHGVFKLEWMPHPWSDVDAAGPWLLAIAERVKPDIVHLNGFAHAALPWKVPTVVFHHSDCLSWWEAVKGEPASTAGLEEYERRVRGGLHAANLVVAPTAAMLEEAKRLYGPLPSSMVIHNGRDGSEYVAGAKKNLVFSAGRFWDEAKNLQVLQQIAPRIEWPVYVAGDAGEPQPVANLTSLGRLCPQTISTWYSRAAIYASPAKYEPFGLSVLEAARCGCALVLGDIPTLRELWDGAAVFLDPSDPEAWVAAINGLARNPSKREELSLLAVERAKSYTAKNMSCSTLFAYQDLLQSSVLDVSYHPGVSLL